MVSSEAIVTDGVPGANGVQDAPFRLRSYQAEMVEESLRSNIIW